MFGSLKKQNKKINNSGLNFWQQYQTSPIKQKLRTFLINEFNLTSQNLYNTSITSENMNDFMNTVDTVHNRIKYYDNRLSGKPNNNSNNTNGTKFRNSNIEDKIKIAKFLLGDRDIAEYWQIFGIVLYVLNNKLELDNLKNIGEKYTYDIFNKILTDQQIWIEIKKKLGGTNDNLFDYLSGKYCGNTSANLINKLPKSTGNAIHQLTKNMQNKIKDKCDVYEGSKLDQQCVDNMVCNFIIYHQSLKELKTAKYEMILGEIYDNIVVYYITLAKIYSEIFINLRERYQKTQNLKRTGEQIKEDYKKLNRPVSKFMYWK
jgi:hypothetical protein